MSEYLTLKWGTMKGWKLESEASRAAGQAYLDAGPQSMSAIMQHDSDEQKLALCALIDVVDGPIKNDWEGTTMTRDQAKKYVMDYDK